MSQPLTDEQIWGEPDVAAKRDGYEQDYCPYLERLCGFWDGDCRAAGGVCPFAAGGAGGNKCTG